MARTKASVGAKVASGKSSKVRAITAAAAPSHSSNSGGSERSSTKYSGGNPACPRETPKWQKPITNFFIGQKETADFTHNASEDIDVPMAGPSKPTKKRKNIIESDDETEAQVEELPKNTELDESFSLTPLDGESSHKIQEYLIENKENVFYNQNDNDKNDNVKNDNDKNYNNKNDNNKNDNDKNDNNKNENNNKRKSSNVDLDCIEEINNDNKRIKID